MRSQLRRRQVRRNGGVQHAAPAVSAAAPAARAHRVVDPVARAHGLRRPPQDLRYESVVLLPRVDVKQHCDDNDTSCGRVLVHKVQLERKVLPVERVLGRGAELELEGETEGWFHGNGGRGRKETSAREVGQGAQVWQRTVTGSSACDDGLVGGKAAAGD